MGDQVDFLIDGRHPKRLGRFWRLGVDLDAIQADRSAVPGIDARQGFDEGAFACAIFPHQAVDFAAADSEVYVLERLDAGEIFAETANLQQLPVGSHGNRYIRPRREIEICRRYATTALPSAHALGMSRALAADAKPG